MRRAIPTASAIPSRCVEHRNHCPGNSAVRPSQIDMVPAASPVLTASTMMTSFERRMACSRDSASAL